MKSAMEAATMQLRMRRLKNTSEANHCSPALEEQHRLADDIADVLQNLSVDERERVSAQLTELAHEPSGRILKTACRRLLIKAKPSPKDQVPPAH